MAFTLKSVPLLHRLQGDLDDAKQRLAELEAQRGPLSLAMFDGLDGADAKVVQWRRDMADGRERLADLESALGAAIARAEQQERERLASIRKSQIASIRGKLADQQKRIVALAAALENTSNAYADVSRLAGEIRDTADAAGITLLPWSALINPERLRQLAAIELWRINRAPQDGMGKFPAAFFGVNEAEDYRGGIAVEGHPDLKSGNPKNALSLVDRLDNERARLIGHITGAAPPPPKTAPALERAKPIPLSAFARPSDAPKDSELAPTPRTDAETLAADAAEQELLRQFDAAVIAGAAERAAEQAEQVQEPVS
jgi:hypothetical protein